MKKRLMNIKKERKIEEDEKRLKNTFDFFYSFEFNSIMQS